MSDLQPIPGDNTARRYDFISAFVIAALLGLFWFISVKAVADKSPTYDETLHLVAAWIQTHHGDFRCDPEYPALWKYYAVIGTSSADLLIIQHSPFYDQMLTGWWYYFPLANFAAGSERGGLRPLGDSNLDWGQDLRAPAQWQKEQTDRQLYLCYFGTANPRFYGIHYINLPGSEAPADQLATTGNFIAIAISAPPQLQGIYQTDEQRRRYVPSEPQPPPPFWEAAFISIFQAPQNHDLASW